MRYTYNNKLLQSLIIVTLKHVHNVVYSSIVPIFHSRPDSDTIDCLCTPPHLACAIVRSRVGIAMEIGPMCHPSAAAESMGYLLLTCHPSWGQCPQLIFSNFWNCSKRVNVRELIFGLQINIDKHKANSRRYDVTCPDINFSTPCLSLKSFKGDMQRYITKFMKSGF